MKISNFKLYNTLTRQVEPLRTLQPDRVLIYTCGPTVYGDMHLGNWRTFIFEDVLVKTLAYFGYTVQRIMNITDVGHLTSDQDEGEDKLQLGAEREGMTAWEIAKKYEARFLDDLKALNIQVPELVRATDTIPEQIRFVQELEQKGYTYKTEDGIYFDSSKVPDYGKLARLDIEGLRAGARVAMQAGKRQPTDFALWKFSPPLSKRDMEWDSPWGRGFPGWHLECSAIIKNSLGEQIDIHCGGIDHIPVHHTNEIAQSEALTGKPLATYWLHAEFLLESDGKISKSKGSELTLENLRAHNLDPLAFRLFTYSASYRSKQHFSWEDIQAAQTSLGRLRQLVSALPEGETEVDLSQAEAALADDLNMPQLMATVWQTLRADISGEAKRRFIKTIDQILSLDLERAPEPLPVPPEVTTLLQEREEARRSENWQEADSLRDQILAAGFEVIDQPDGPILRSRL